MQTTTGTAAELHDREVPHQPDPTVWVHRLERPAIVLGSSQDTSLLDQEATAADGIEVCRRRSGGGIVGLQSNDHVWIDVIVPATSRLWSDDVQRAFHWLGLTWASTLAVLLSSSSQHATSQHATSPHAISIHRGPATERIAGRLICFAALGAGEVSVDGYKVVGLSQRRTKESARFQCAALLRWDPDFYSRYVTSDALRAADIDLSTLKAGLGEGDRGPTQDSVIEAFLEQLPPDP